MHINFDFLKRHDCDVCGQEFTSIHDLDGHRKTHICDVCGKKFKSTDDLKAHVQLHSQK